MSWRGAHVETGQVLDEGAIGGGLATRLSRLRALLPTGGELPQEEWRRRHRGLVAFLWVNVAVVIVLSIALGSFSAAHTLEHGIAIGPLALLASLWRLSEKTRSVAVVLGLMTAAALFTHMSGGLLETHFYFFVLVVLLTLYEDWLVFLVTVGYVLLHHGIIGMIAPAQVFDRPDAFAEPWKWAAIHAVYVAGAGVAGIVAWRLNENVRGRMRAAQVELSAISETDSLTGLGNRRKLMADLELALEDGDTAVLVMLDLDGFKAYNDTFGHGAGDALLARLGQRLATRLHGAGSAYRPGGDEFCVLAPASSDTAASLEALAVDALSDVAGAFAVSAASGAVLLGEEAQTVSSALGLADQRMYAQKAGKRTGAGRQAKDVLLATLSARSPDLGRHTTGVAELTDAVGRRLGLPEEDLIAIRQAADLHDIGKMGIPDAILQKPGPLTPEEWAFMHQHTIIGERIVSVAPALVRVGQLIRSSHERFDGAGYPDRLAGEEIPIGSRVIAVCDAYEAIVSDRPYRAARTPEEALAELRRCAGEQFDPAVVAAFEATLSAVAGSVPSGRVS
jgi:diguanylate cyclase (GGDEF)-like protein